jgi:CheY-like chemotaxis protein
VVDDGVDAIKAVQEQRYDLVLMDVQMPGMDGIAATRHSRGLGHVAPTLTIIAMTANVMPAQVAQFRAAGFNDHVAKPFRRSDLLGKVAQWTEGLAGPPAVSAGEGGSPRQRGPGEALRAS